MQHYRSKPVEPKRASVLVIHCSDPRYQPHFQDFVRSGLGITHYGLIAVPGGTELLSPSEVSRGLREQGGAWLEFMANLMSAERCILIGHGDCRWYLEQHIEPNSNRLKDHQVRDLQSVRYLIHQRFPRIKVELYFAELEEQQASFTMLEEPAENLSSTPTGEPEFLRSFPWTQQ